MFPFAPLIESLELPTGVEPEVLILSTEEPDPVMDDGLNVAVAPLGNPMAFRLTVPVNPTPAVTVTL